MHLIPCALDHLSFVQARDLLAQLLKLLLLLAVLFAFCVALWLWRLARTLSLILRVVSRFLWVATTVRFELH